MVQVRGKLKFRTTQFTELTDSQWEVIKEIVDNSLPRNLGGRKRKYCLRIMMNAILKVVRTGV
ncbi:MAG: transposase [Saprospiraceae bacterium]